MESKQMEKKINMILALLGLCGVLLYGGEVLWDVEDGGQDIS